MKSTTMNETTSTMETNELSERNLGSISGGTMSVHDWIGGIQLDGLIVVIEPKEIQGQPLKAL